MEGMVASPAAEARVVGAQAVAMGVAAAGDSGHGWVPKAAARVEEAWAVATVVV